MIIGFAKETFPGEKRVALIPAIIPSLKKAGFEIVMESGAGKAAGFLDPQYADKGVKLIEKRCDVFSAADILLFVRALAANRVAGKADFPLMHRGQIMIGMMEPSSAQDDIEQLNKAGITAFAMELLPRVSRAQSMDVLSSMATVAGYKAVILAAERMPKMFPMLMTAAGTVAPARVFVVGAGVAGLQAIATAKRLGAIVQAYDIRPAVKEQVESLGAKFAELPLETSSSEGSGGYAKAMDEEFLKKQRQLMGRLVAESDAVITTASVPGKKAPILITKEMIAQMKIGSVLVDLAAAQGGNCELTQPDKEIKVGEVTIVGPINLAASAPFDASQMYARNLVNFLLYITKDGQLKLDIDDEIIRATMISGQQDTKMASPK